MIASVPSVSIILPVRNEAATIEALLRDLLVQQRRAEKIFVIDTGSQDDTCERVRRLALANPSIELLSAPNGYPGAGRNAGLRAAQSEWVAFIDGGMRTGTDWLMRLMAPVDGGEPVDVVLGNFEPVTRQRAERAAALAFVPARRPTPTGGYWRDICLPSSAVRRSLALAVGGFPDQLRSGEDLIFLHAICQRGRVAYAPAAIVNWEIVSTPSAIWRRFRTYGEHGFRGHQMGTWPRTIAKRYLAALLAGPAAPLPIAALLLARAAWSQRRKPEFVESGLTSRLRQIIEVALVLGIIDLATITAWWAWLRSQATIPPASDDPSRPTL